MSWNDFATGRRAVLAGMGASVGALALPGCATLDQSSSAALPAGGPSLNALAQRSGRRFGSAVASNPMGRGGSIQNPAYAEVVRSECGVIVPENELKWTATHPAPGTYDFQRMDAIVAWAQANGIAVRGHTLLWHRTRWFPEWLNNYDYGANPAQEAERMLVDHIRTVTDRYRGVIHSYDVVNETVKTDGTGLEETSMSRAMGGVEQVVDLAFHTAREQLPDAQLVYNDYMSWEPDHQKHVSGVLKLLEGFRKRNVPVDALGIQSHIEMSSLDPATGVGPYLESEWRHFLDEVTAMGYKLLITEFDVKDNALPGDIAVRDERVADFTRRYMDVMLDYPQLGDILAWGMVSPFSWLQGFAAREDGLPQRCCPYDENYRPTEMRTALAESFLQAAG